MLRLGRYDAGFGYGQRTRFATQVDALRTVGPSFVIDVTAVVERYGVPRPYGFAITTVVPALLPSRS
jgi:hypothetical protein